MNNNSITNGYKLFDHPFVGKIKIIDAFEGNINNFNLGPQQKNFEKINSVLNEFSIYPIEIIYVKWKSPYGGNRTHFIVKYSDPNIIWRKYESNAQGSGHNHIYIKNAQIKLTEFTRDDIIDFK